MKRVFIKDNVKVEIEWTLKNGRFSMSGVLYERKTWKSRWLDISAGQNIDEILKLFPETALIQRMHKVWQRWHLNDLKAGSPRQEAYLLEHPVKASSFNYFDEVCKALRNANLEPDDQFMYHNEPYRYGSAWLSEELPEDIKKEIESWSNESDDINSNEPTRALS